MRSSELPVLMPREREVLTLLADQLVISQIARRLFISESTAKIHVANVYEKLHATNRAEAVRAGRRFGLIDGDDDGGALVPATPTPRPPTLPPRAVALEPPLAPPAVGDDQSHVEFRRERGDEGR